MSFGSLGIVGRSGFGFLGIVHQSGSGGGGANQFYGVERSRSVADPAFEQIGNAYLHESLPLHSLIRPCKVSEDRKIINYLNPANWNYNADGTPSILDGSDGFDVMLHYPECYAILDGGVDTEIWAIGKKPFTYKGIQARHIKSFVRSPDYCTVDRTTNKSRCVSNSTDANLAGSGSVATAGGLGYARTSVTRYNYEVYATNKGAKWNNWLYVDELMLAAYMYIEYATLNLKSVFGQLAANWADANWAAYNGRNPVVKILETHLALSGTPGVVLKGHLTGVYNKQFSFLNGETQVSYTTGFGVYRGQFLWGHLWKWLSGIEIEIQSNASGGASNLYVQFDTDNIDANRSNSSFAFKDTYQHFGVIPRSTGWVKNTNQHTNQPKELGGAETTYKCLYMWTSIPASGTERRGVLVGATLDTGSPSSLASAASNHVPSISTTHIGSGFRAEVES